MKCQMKRILGLVLVIALTLSMVPMAALAQAAQGMIPEVEQDGKELNVATPSTLGDISTGTTTDDPTAPGPEDPPESGIEDPTESGAEQPPKHSPEEPSDKDDPESKVSPTDTVPKLTKVTPQLTKIVDEPLVKVVYHYFDAAENQGVTDFSDYTVASSHSYYAIAMASGKAISISANKYPSIVPVNTDSLHFQVLLNGSEDITSVAEYDPASGSVLLPNDYMGHNITVNWYCPTSDIKPLSFNVKICIGDNGKFTTTTEELVLPSDARNITVPFTIANGVVVSQNGIDLSGDKYSVKNGKLVISASALGGDLSVSAYVLSLQRVGFGIMPMGTSLTQVTHTRSSNQIYYGYYTSYYTANGNTAFCLDPGASGLNSGTYNISRYLQRGTGDDTLIKCAYYLYGGPGYNSVKNSLFSSPDTMTAYGLCHAAASYVYLNNDDAFKGLSSSMREQLLNLISKISAMPMPPAGFDAFIYNASSSTTQSLMGWDYSEPTEPYEPPAPPADGHLEIIKVSANPAMTDGNSCYSLAGAVFDVYNSSNQRIGSITTDASGRGRLQGLPPESGYYIREVSAPQGYALNSSNIGFYILSDQTTTVTVSDLPQNDPVGIILRKQDAETSADVPQGGATHAGAEFTVKYYKGLYSNASQLSSTAPARTWVLRTGVNGTAYLNAAYLVSGDPFYFAGNGDPTLPLGTVTIQETKAPEGYLINSELFLRQITSTGTAESVRTYNAPIVPENVIRGGVSIEKWDNELDRKAAPQGDATLEGAVFEIWNRNVNSVLVEGTMYAPGTVVYTMTTDATGTATTANDSLPYGQYEIIEKTPPTGYLETGVIRQTFNITNQGVIVSLKTSNTAIKNNVIRGGVEIEKWDIERGQPKLKQGDATLEGAVLEIWNRSANLVLVGGTEYAPNTVVHTMTTNADGWAGTANDLLPFGSYEIIEKTPPTGYRNTGIIRQSFQIREHGVIVGMLAEDTVIKNNVIRGGVRIEKWDNEIDEHRAQGGATLEGAVFEIVNRSADSVLVLGVWCEPGDVVYVYPTDSTGSALTPNDLLPYGTYEVREIEPPTGYLATGVLSRTFTIREQGKIVELDTSETAIKNNPIRGDLRGVKISDGDAKRLAYVPFRITSKSTSESHVIVTDRNGEFNTASSWNPHSQHTNRGASDRDGVWFGELRTLNDDLGALLYDTYIMEELRCASNKDYQLLTFEVSVYRHNTVVDLGTLTDDYIAVPGISTTAMGQDTTTEHSYSSKTTTIIDTVYYSGLKVGNEYTLKGILYDKSTGNPLLVDGKEVTAEQKFKASSEAGTVTMQFVFDSLALKGKAVVVFETLFFDGNEIAAHTDIEDEGQTVTFDAPKIGTSAADLSGKKELGTSAATTIVDTVTYENLTPGEIYTVKGTLMDKATGKPILVQGKEVTAETTFTAAAASGTVQVTFTFNSVELAGKTVVVFETLVYKGSEIAVHADINDQGQSVSFNGPKIGTNAAGMNGEKDLDTTANVSIVDTITYENLVPGETYTLKGVLMDKSTGTPLMAQGRGVTAETTFTPALGSGTVKVTFTLNAVELKGKTVVVFETLEHQGKVIAVHTDINDSNQTVTFRGPMLGTTASGKDGRKTIPLSESAVVIDKVSYSNLVAGQTYMLKGILMDKGTGRPVHVNGIQITSEVIFVPTAHSGIVEVQFTFNSTGLSGKTLVVFESLEQSGKEIATHTDINDAAQAVTVETKKPGSPQTGQDGLPIWLLIVGLVAALGAVLLLLYLRMHKRQTELSDTDD